MRTLVLWDIDHTLLSIDGLSSELYSNVFLEITGREPERLAPMAGRTDLAIIADTLRAHALAPTPEIVTAFADALAKAFAGNAAEVKRRGRVLSGVRAILEALAARTDVIQSVLTGNMEPIARCKLSALDLHTLIDTEVGAYGLDDADRPPLVALARQRAARKYGRSFAPSDTVLIGDTPHDVDAAHRTGARIIAVATGSANEQTLRAAGADQVLPNLTDTTKAIHSILAM